MDKSECDNSIVVSNNRNTVREKSKNERSLSRRIIQRLNENELNSLDIFSEAPITSRVSNGGGAKKQNLYKSQRE